MYALTFATACRLLLLTTALVCAVSVPAVRASTIYLVDIDTSSFAGTTADLVFDLIDGDGINNSTLTISGFTTDGLMGSSSGLPSASISGTIFGSLAISDTDFFNEFAQSILLGAFARFRFSYTSDGPGALIPDQLSLFLLGPGGSIIPTSDPSGSDALLAFDLNGVPAAVLQVFDDATHVGVAADPVPEPGSAILVGTGIAAWYVRRRRCTLSTSRVVCQESAPS